MTTRSVQVGPWTFDHWHYDRDADVLYLTIGEPRRAVGDETPDGHIAMFDEETGEFCGLTMIGLRDLPTEDGWVTVSVPARVESEHLNRLVCA